MKRGERLRRPLRKTRIRLWASSTDYRPGPSPQLQFQAQSPKSPRNQPDEIIETQEIQPLPLKKLQSRSLTLSIPIPNVSPLPFASLRHQTPFSPLLLSDSKPQVSPPSLSPSSPPFEAPIGEKWSLGDDHDLRDPGKVDGEQRSLPSDFPAGNPAPPGENFVHIQGKYEIIRINYCKFCFF